MHSRHKPHDFTATYQEGLVVAIDAKKCKVQVKFPALDNLISGWLAVRCDYAHGNQSYAIPDINTLVACILDARGESGMVMGAIYNEQDPPPANSENLWVKQFSDGTRIEHNRASNIINITGVGTINITCPTTNINGDINVNNGTITVTGGDVIADGISLKQHMHKDVTAGKSKTGKPTP